jgi:acyl-CoA thioesterase I
MPENLKNRQHEPGSNGVSMSKGQSTLIQTGNRILFQGDSVTNAFRKPEEICNAYQLGSGYAMMVAAQILAARPTEGLTFLNRGVSGQGVRDLQARWQEDCLELKPDVLSILVGVNDAGPQRPEAPLSVEEYEQHYRDLLQATRDALPAVRLVLGEPFVLPCKGVMERVFDDVAARGDVVNRLADDFDAAVVPLQDVFAEAQKKAPPEYWAFDGFHPTAQGHWLIAKAWLKATGH